MSKFESAYKTIGEVVKIVGLKSKKGDTSPTHTIRYWEKEFKQIKPKILNGNRRYYDQKNIDLIKKVHFLLKDQGMTIKGVKKILNNFDTLKLAQRFQRIAKSQSKTIKSELVGILGNKDDSARRNYLKRLIRSKKATYGSNYWLVALYQAFLNYSGDLDDLK